MKVMNLKMLPVQKIYVLRRLDAVGDDVGKGDIETMKVVKELLDRLLLQLFSSQL